MAREKFRKTLNTEGSQLNESRSKIIQLSMSDFFSDEAEKYTIDKIESEKKLKK